MCQEDKEESDTLVSPELVEVTDSDATVLEEVQATLGEGYEVLALLRAGGTGNVYKVRDTRLDKTFAVKVLHGELAADINTVKMFQRQAQAAQDLTHANLAAVYQCELGTNGRPFIVMDHLDGDTLAEELCQNGFMDVPRALDIFIQLAEALVHAHMKGVVHYDLKPTSVVLCKGNGGQDFVKLVDFGIARNLPSSESGVNSSGSHPNKQVSGSPRYMSPEQCLSRPLDARSDIYSLGCMMYEALTNVPVFEDKNPIRTMVKQVGSKPKHFGELKHEYAIPEPLEQVVFRCLEKNPSGRYQNAQLLLDDLQRVRNGEPLSPPPEPENRRFAWAWDEGPRISLIAFAATVSALIVVWLFSMYLLQTHFNQVTESPVVVAAAPPPFVVPPAPEPDYAETLTADAAHDAEVMENFAKRYYHAHDYRRAAPLFEFVIETYNDGLMNYQDSDIDRLELATKCRRAARCYTEIDDPTRAVPHLRQAILLIQETADPGDELSESIQEYTKVLRLVGDAKTAKLVEANYKKDGRLKVIP